MPTILILPLGDNGNTATLFDPLPGMDPTWALTEGNGAKKHLLEETVCMFVKPGPTRVCPPVKPHHVLFPSVPNTTGAIVAIGVVDKVVHDPSGAMGDRLWSNRLSYQYGKRHKVTDESFTYVFTVKDLAMTPWWGKQPMKALLGLKESDPLLGARGIERHPSHPVWAKMERVWADCSDEEEEEDDDDEPLVFIRTSQRRTMVDDDYDDTAAFARMMMMTKRRRLE